MATQQLLIPPTTRAEDGGKYGAAAPPPAASPPQACAACKHQRKKCGRSCLLAPYFPPERAMDFHCVHRVFGVSNVAKRLRALGGEDRARAADAMVWEARCWIDGDPVRGAHGLFLRQQQAARALRLRMRQCVLCCGRNMAPAGDSEMMNHPAYENGRLPMPDLHNYQQYPQVQGGHGTGQLLQLPALVLPENMINMYGHHQQHYIQFPRSVSKRMI